MMSSPQGVQAGLFAPRKDVVEESPGRRREVEGEQENGRPEKRVRSSLEQTQEGGAAGRRALRTAQLAMLSDIENALRAPYDWAAFQLVGNIQ